MKNKFFLLILFSLIVNCVNAQKGGLLIYGNLQGLTSKDDISDYYTKVTINSITVAPGIGYAISRHFILGFNFLYKNYEETKNITGVGFFGHVEESTKEVSYGIGPFIRYIKPISNIFDFRLQLNFSYLNRLSTYKSDDTGGARDKTNLKGLDLNFRPSIGINVGKHWCIDVGYGTLEYLTAIMTTDYQSTPYYDYKRRNNGFLLDINYTSFSLGVAYMIGGGEKKQKATEGLK